jgi:excinuclease ABC subunit A
MTAQAFALGLTNDNFRRNCSACKGRGLLSFDMDFLPAVHEPCETCRGTGFLPEAWQVKWRDISLPDLIALTIDEVFTIVKDQLPLARNLEAAREVGLGYLVLRQPGFALSGGEVQRLRIAKELARKTKSQTLYILDEPTVGLHLDDVHNLLEILNRLVDRGHTVIVIEHHTSLLAACDWLLEFGPGGGPDGGRLIASGSPQMLAQGQTPTAPYLIEALSLGEEIES